MCQLDPAIEPKIEQTIKQFLDEGRMFTGYDVTLETRTRENVQMRHKDVRGGIHEIQCLVDAIEWGHEDGQGNDVRWKKSQISMPGGQWAFVYHSETADPNQYQPQGQSAAQATQQIKLAQQQAVATQTPVMTATQGKSDSTSDSGGQNDDGSFSTDYRNRLFIRTGFLKDLGLVKDDTVHVITDTDNHRVLLATDYTTDMDTVLSGSSSHTQQVERNGDIRLSSKTLRTAGLDITEDFAIEKSNLDVNGSNVTVVEIRQAT